MGPGSHLRAWLRRQPAGLADGALALLAGVSQLWLVAVRPAWPYGLHAGPPATWLAVGLGLAATVPVAWRRRAPGTVLVLVGAAAAAMAVLGVPVQGFGTLIALYTVAAYSPWRRSLMLLGLLVAGAGGSLLVAGALEFAPSNALVFAATWVLGDRRRLERARAASLTDRARHLATERRDGARLAAATERERIAGELHDILAHRIAAMVAQSQAAVRLLRGGGATREEADRAATALAAVERSGRDSLTELRRLVCFLRQAGAGRAGADGPGTPSSDDDGAGTPRGDGAGTPRGDGTGTPSGDGTDRPAGPGDDGTRAGARAWAALPTWAQDGALAGLVAGVELASFALVDPAVWLWGDVVQAPLSLGSVLVVISVHAPLVLRRTWPGVTLALVTAAGLASVLAGVPMQLLAVLVALYTVAAYRPRAHGLVWLAGLLALGPVALAVAGAVQLAPIQFVTVATAWLLGERQRARLGSAAELEARAARLERDRRRAAAIAAAEERTRIARELHDILAHSVSLMVVQAGAARRALRRDAREAREMAEHVTVTGRASLTQVRRLLGLLDDHAGAQYVPQPGLQELDGLVERFTRAGLPVRLDRHGDPRPLPASTDLSAYRIIQESLTNALKHAGRTPVTVTLDYAEEALCVHVSDGGRTGGTARRAHDGRHDAGPGHGLAGMRERAALVGGWMSAGAQPGGGFQVRATLPLEDAP